MLIRKLNRLTAEQIARDLPHLRKLHEEGIDVELPEPALCPLEILAAQEPSVVFSFSPWQSGYALNIQLTAQANITLVEFTLGSPFHELALHFVAETDSCKFGPCSYPVGQILNDLFENPLSMSKGTVRRGALLAVGEGPIPSETQSFDVVIQFLDSLHRQVSTNILVRKQEWAGTTKPLQLSGRRRSSLYDDASGRGEPRSESPRIHSRSRREKTFSRRSVKNPS